MKIILLLNKGNTKKKPCKIKLKMYNFAVVILPRPLYFLWNKNVLYSLQMKKDYKQEK